MSFGSVEQAMAAARHLHLRHQGIHGTMPETVGAFAAGSRYEANEVHALRWVYATLIDSSVMAYDLVLPALTSAEREQYYAESRTSATFFGIAPDAWPADWQRVRGVHGIHVSLGYAGRQPGRAAPGAAGALRRRLVAANSVLVSRADGAPASTATCAKSSALPMASGKSGLRSAP